MPCAAAGCGYVVGAIGPVVADSAFVRRKYLAFAKEILRVEFAYVSCFLHNVFVRAADTLNALPPSFAIRKFN